MIGSFLARARRSSWPARCIRLLLVVSAGTLLARFPARAQDQEQSKTIFVLPALQWNGMGAVWEYTTSQTDADLARAMGGLTFGLTPEAVAKHMPDYTTALHWDNLPEAKGFSQDVRYVWMPVKRAGWLLSPVTACFGDSSYVALLFRNDALFRVSWHFLPGPQCDDPHVAADQLYAAYVQLLPNIANSVLYRAGLAEVVDVSNPHAGALLAQRGRI